MRKGRARGVVRRLSLTVALACAGAGLALPISAPTAMAADPADLYLVTLEGPGSAGYTGPLTTAAYTNLQLISQDSVLSGIDVIPTYRWTTALNGFAARLTATQAAALARDPRVALVESNDVRRLAGGRAATTSGAPQKSGSQAPRAGAGVVIAMIDSGLWPEGPVFADVKGLGRAPERFVGDCVPGEGWSSEYCDRKVVGARWFVDGFGVERLRSSSALSALDDDGHGTMMASIAAGNAGVTAQVPGQRSALYTGTAPAARLAIYKACWTAPDPADDGCATADLVTAIDQAVADRVDVVNLSVEGPPRLDTVERALLGAAEADIVVVAAAGNRGPQGYAAHPSPWVTTVGGTTGSIPRGLVKAPGLRVFGAMAAVRGTRATQVVMGADVAAPGVRPQNARFCAPGTLDAGQVSGSIVVCERGQIGRVEKSAAVDQADGVGMILLNTAAGVVNADFHSVPTVQLAKADAKVFVRWQRRHVTTPVRLLPDGNSHPLPRMVAWSSAGDPRSAVLKPDVVAAAVGVLAATAPYSKLRWGQASGTSAAAAMVSGAAAGLLARHDWNAAAVRSALATTAARLDEPTRALRSGSGRVRPHAALKPGLTYDLDPADYRAWLDGHLAGYRLNTPSIVIRNRLTVTRTITNRSDRAMYYSSSVTGFAGQRVTVTPAAVRLTPGESATYTVRVRGRGPRFDDGSVTWLGADQTKVKIPVLIN